jgi:hypothetical protein
MSKLAIVCSTSLLLALASAPLMAEDPKPIEPFNGKDLSGWKVKAKKTPTTGMANWVVGTATVDKDKPAQFKVDPAGNEMINAKGGGLDIYCEQTFGDCVIEVEVTVPKGSNSGIYVMGEYEIQVLDSAGKQKVGPGDMGGIYGASAPKVNACKQPGEWNKFVIDFRAPKFDAQGKKTANARILKCTLNDQAIHENVEMKGPTPSGVTGKERPTGPIMFQGDHGPVAYRNIKITPVK